MIIILGLGVCRCGQCQCNKPSDPDNHITGKYCECDNFSCRRSNNLVCSGRGKCECGGKCTCNPGWAGEACECPTDTLSCKNLKTGDICSNHGSCECGSCKCSNEGDVRYTGKYCDECPTCSGQRCDELSPCVQCQAYESGPYDSANCTKVCTFRTILVDEVDKTGNADVKICTLPDTDGCTFSFQYEYLQGDEKPVVKAEKEKSCPLAAPVVLWVLGVITSILVAGLIMLIVWKVFTTIHDRREYAKFENERQNLKWHTNKNPLYKEAVTSFSNPVYNKSSGNRFSFRVKEESENE